MIDYGVHVKDVVGDEIWRASREFKVIGHDPFRMPGFWEAREPEAKSGTGEWAI